MSVPIATITEHLAGLNRLYPPERFVPRRWLVEKVTQFRDSADGRHLLIVGPPGSGKTALLAHLTREWNCPRHFVRAGHTGGVVGRDPPSFLLSLGAQLRQKYGPEPFRQPESGQVQVSVDLSRDRAVVVGRVVHELVDLPFDVPSADPGKVEVREARDESRVVGEMVGRLVRVAESLPVTTLLEVALLKPLRKLAELDPTERVVVLVDALDEALSGSTPGIIDVLPRATDIGFPPNLRLIMTSRNAQLASFRAEDQLSLDREDIQRYVRQDLRDYVTARLARPPLSAAVAGWSLVEREEYVHQVVEQSDGNFLYLYHYFTQLEGAAASGALDVKTQVIPRGLDEIYRYFAVERIQQNVADRVRFTASVDVPTTLVEKWKRIEGDPAVYVEGREVTVTAVKADALTPQLFSLSGEEGVQLTNFRVEKGCGPEMWKRTYLPLLGVLGVAYEPLTRGQWAGFGGVEARSVDELVRELLPLLDVVSGPAENRFQFYHRSFAEYLLDPARNRDYPLEAAEYHTRIANYYRAGRGWGEVDWDAVPDSYPFYHLPDHLAADRAGDLGALLTRSWMTSQLARTGSPAPFARALDLLLNLPEADRGTILLRQVRGCLFYGSVGALAGHAPPDLMGVLVRLGRADQARGYAALIDDLPRRSRAFLRIGQALLGAGRADEAAAALRQALAAARSAEKGTLRFTYGLSQHKLYQEIAEGFARAGQVGQALEAVRYIDEGPFAGNRTEAIGSLADIRAQAGDVAGLTELAEAVSHRDRWSRPEALARVCEALARVGAGEQARRLSDGPDSEADREKVRNGIARGLADAGQTEEALALASQPEGQAGVQMRTVAYLVRRGELARARMVALMGLDGPASLAALNLVVRGYLDSGDTKRAKRTAVEEYLQFEREPAGARADDLFELARLLEQTDNPRLASKVLQAILDEAASGDPAYTPGPINLGRVAQALLRRGQHALAERVARLTVDRLGTLKDRWLQDSELERLAEALARAGGLDLASDVAHRIQERSAQDRVVIALPRRYVEGLLEAKAFTEARKATERLIPASRIETLTALAVALLDSEDRAGAEEATATVLALSRTMSPEFEKREALGQMAIALAETGRGDDALALLLPMPRISSLRIAALAGVGGGLCRAGQPDRGRELVLQSLIDTVNLARRLRREPAHDKAEVELAQEMSVVLRTLASVQGVERSELLAPLTLIGDLGQRGLGLAALTRALWEAGRQERVAWVAGLAEQALGRLPAGSSQKVLGLAYLAQALAQAGERERAAPLAVRAREAAEVVHGPRWGPGVALGEAVAALSSAGLLDDALELADRESGDAREELLLNVAKGLAAGGDHDNARKVADELGDDAKAEALTVLARHLLGQGLRERAADVARQARLLLVALPDAPSENSTRQQLAPVLALAAGLDEGLALARGLADPDQRAGALAAVARRLEKGEGALPVWLEALGAARLAGRPRVFRVLGDGAPLLAGLDAGRTLRAVIDTLQEVESWWGSGGPAPPPRDWGVLDIPDVWEVAAGQTFRLEVRPDPAALLAAEDPPMPLEPTAANEAFWKALPPDERRNVLAVACLGHPDARVRLATLGALEDLPATTSLNEALTDLLVDADGDVSRAAGAALWRLHAPTACRQVLLALCTEIQGFSSSSGVEPVRTLGRLRAIEALDHLVACAPTEDDRRVIQALADELLIIEERIEPADVGTVLYRGIHRQDQFTYEVYLAESRRQALAFLKSKVVNRAQHYLEVETPEGVFGKDIRGMYQVR